MYGRDIKIVSTLYPPETTEDSRSGRERTRRQERTKPQVTGRIRHPRELSGTLDQQIDEFLVTRNRGGTSGADETRGQLTCPPHGRGESRLAGQLADQVRRASASLAHGKADGPE